MRPTMCTLVCARGVYTEQIKKYDQGRRQRLESAGLRLNTGRERCKGEDVPGRSLRRVSEILRSKVQCVHRGEEEAA